MLKCLQEVRDLGSLVMLVVTGQRGLDLMRGKELFGPARIFSGDQSHLTQDPDRPQGHVLQITDRGSHHIERRHHS